jgi:hypothetical protein
MAEILPQSPAAHRFMLIALTMGIAATLSRIFLVLDLYTLDLYTLSNEKL